MLSYLFIALIVSFFVVPAAVVKLVDLLEENQTKAICYVAFVANVITVAMIPVIVAWPAARPITLTVATLGALIVAVCQIAIRAENLRYQRAAQEQME